MWSKRNNWNRLRNKDVSDRRWYVYKWEVLVIIGLALLAALLNEIPNWYVKPLADGTIDPIMSYPLINNITYTTISIIFTVGISIFIGVFTEVGKFAGKYGSAIFVLVPSFVWLLSDRADDRVEDIVNTAIFLGTLLFWLIVGIASLFIFLLILKYIIKGFVHSARQKMIIEFAFNYINRYLIIIINIIIVLMLGYSLINYGILSLHLADITPEMHKANPVLLKSKTHDLHSESFTTYIGIISIFFALLMVLIGLSNIFSRKIKIKENKKHEEKQLLKVNKNENFDTLTIEIRKRPEVKRE